MPALSGLLLTTRLGVVTPPISATATLRLSGYSIRIYSGAQLTYTLEQPYQLFSYGYRQYDTKGFLGVLSGYSFSATCGGTVALSVTVPALLASGTAEQRGQVSAKLPTPTLLASGTTDRIGRVGVTLGHYSLNIVGGARVTGTLPTLHVSSSATTDRLGRVSGTLPIMALLASGTTDRTGEVVGVLPTLRLAPSGVLVATLPRAQVLISGTEVIAVEYEAYSMLFPADPPKPGDPDVYTTHYTNYPFDRMLRFGNKYYGVAADGLYELDGDDFNGTPIVATVLTAPTDFNAHEVKRPVSLYIAGEVEADFRVSVTAAENKTNSYIYRALDKTGARNYRVMLGKGIRARYLSYGFTNTNGGDFEIDDITPEFVVTRRTA